MSGEIHEISEAIGEFRATLRVLNGTVAALGKAVERLEKTRVFTFGVLCGVSVVSGSAGAILVKTIGLL